MKVIKRVEPNGGPNAMPNGGVAGATAIVKQPPSGFAALTQMVRAKEREFVALGEIKGPGGFDMGDTPPGNIVGDPDTDLNPMKPPTSMADVAEMFVDYSSH